VCVILPTYNERETLPALLEQLAVAAAGARLDCEAVVVDDGSPDGTAEAASRAAAGLRDRLAVVIIGRRAKTGLTSAVIDGVRHGAGDVIVVMDADLSHPPELVPRLVEAIARGADVAIGSRYAPGGGIKRWPVERHVISWGATLLARKVLGTRIADPVSGFFAVRRAVFEQVRFAGLGYKLLVEILASGAASRVDEVPYVFTDRTSGRSKLGPGEILNYARLILRLWRTRGRVSAQRMIR
jgi:dolichol-phosphate mannosyltransferase